MILRFYQQLAVDHIIDRLNAGDRRICLSSPTGTGKSLVLLAAQHAIPGSLIVTPRIEIIRGFLQKLGVPTKLLNDQQVADVGLSKGITTPIRALNRVGTPELAFDVLLIDEGHHSLSASYRQLMDFAGALVCLTATPFRGTPRGTEEFYEFWQGCTPILTYAEAAAQDHFALPQIEILPLCDDDLITADLSAGEFRVRSASKLIGSRLDEIVAATGRAQWDRPTMFSFPGRDIIREAEAAFARHGFPVLSVTGDTRDREAIFDQVIACKAALLQINVVSEGVDLPLRRLVDCSPTMSPVRWVQQIGRVTRPPKPGEPPPEYICTNRNLERHAYILADVIPPGTVGDAQKAFDRPTKRSGLRVVGLEGLGRFKPAPLPLADGSTGSLFSLQKPEGAQIRQWVVMVHPNDADPIVATRVNGRDGKTWGKWERATDLPVIEGAVASTSSGTLTPKMRAWWQRSAITRGLDPHAAETINRKTFQVLPILFDIGARFR